MTTYGNWQNDPCYPLCGNGQAQSPIDICSSVDDAGDIALQFDYRPQTLDILNNGQTIKVLCKQQSCVYFDDKPYALQQFHFHHPAEHTIEGQTFAMELHLVHESESGSLLVIAIMINDGGDIHPAYQPLWRHLPLLHNERCQFSHIQVDPATLLPANRDDFYYYRGSLTTPPCTEDIQWVVMATPIKIADSQLTTFATLYACNNRPLQSLNGRIIYHHH